MNWKLDKKMQGRLSFVILLALFASVSFLPRQAAAQDYRAKITVEVKDASDALVPGAALTLTRNSTKTSTSAKIDASGAFIFQFLEPDTYTLHVEAAGMAPAEVKNIVLVAYAATSVPVKLAVGSQSSEVTVTDEPAMLQTETASRAYSIEQTEVQDLPVINGNPIMLGNEVPGVFMRPLGIYTDPWTVTSQFQINGGLMYLNEFLIDGAPNDAEYGADTYAYVLPQFAVKEFTVSANNYDAQYGHTSGGAINTTTMGGTSQFKGLFWSSFRRTDWNANNSQNKYYNSINGTHTGTPFNTQTQLGFQVGGPIFIPHVVKHSHEYQPFFFFAFDHYSELLPRSLTLSYPTARMRTGDFGELLSAGITINDPTTTVNGVRQPFPNNVIPANRINPIAAKIAALLPTVGNTPAGQRPGTNDLSIPNNYYNWHFRNLVGRFDFNIGDKYKFFIRPFTADFTEVSNAGGITGPGENGGTFERFSKGYLVDFVDVVNPKTVLNARFGYTLFRVKWTSPANSGVDLTQYGYPSSLGSQEQYQNFFGSYTFANYSALGWFANVEDTGNYSWEGNLSRQAGNHNVRAGWDVRLTHFSYINPGYFVDTSNSDWTESIQGSASALATSGDSFATFLLGTPSAFTSTFNGVYQISSWYLAPWLQDDWRVTPKLTMNIGLRWDLLTGPVDKQDRLNVGFDPNMPNAVQAQIPASAVAAAPAVSNLTGGLTFANVNGASRSPINNVYHNIQPRFGFSYAVNQRLVVRGGYGLFYTNLVNNALIQNLGFTQTTNAAVSNDGGATPIPNVINNPFPNGVIQPSGSSLGSLTYLGQNFTTFNRNFKLPSAHEFSLGFQYRATKTSVFEASYVGNRGRGYPVSMNENLPGWNFLQNCDQVYNNGTPANCNANAVINPFKGVPAFNGSGNYYSANTIQNYNLQRPHPEFGDITLSSVNRGYEWYNGVQVSYNWRMSHGVSFNTSYVYSKTIYQTGWRNQALNIPQRSVYQFGIPKVFKISGVFQLPFGRNRLFAFHNNRLADYVIGGWEFSPSMQIESGEPATLPTSAIMLPHNRFMKPDWKNYTGAQAWGRCVATKTPGTGVLVPTAYSMNTLHCGSDTSNYDWAVVTLLNNEVANPTYSNVVRMKPVINSDAGLQKSFPIHDFIVATIRLQASNALNHFNMETAKFVIDPSNTAFGTLNQGTVPTSDAPGRNLNVQFRVAF
ncbi:MAG TPA: carboxypeptidase-like regulatory domain-containing protein [Bryocella sp.]|nr:carboxypeptidase-like regulatory domain-containing protein [Bryocella sp.]